MSDPTQHHSYGLIFSGLFFSVTSFLTVGVRSNLPPHVYDRAFAAKHLRWIGLLIALAGVVLRIMGR